MRHDLTIKEEATVAWLQKAKDDLESAQILFKSNKKTQWHQVLFFCQQAVEKSMKAFLTWHDVSFRRTHDLVEIGKECSQIDNTLKKPISIVEELSDYAWEFRYPGEDLEPTKAEAKKGMSSAKKCFQEIVKRIPHKN